MRVGTATKGFTEKVKSELNVKAGKDSDKRKSGWTFNIRGSPEAGLSSDQSIHILEGWARVRSDSKKIGQKLEVIPLPAG